VVLVRQDFDEAQYVAFAHRLGTPQIHLQPHRRHPAWPEIFVSSNVHCGGETVGLHGTGSYWRTDGAFLTEPLPLTMLAPRVVPPTPCVTSFIDMEDIYERLSDPLRRFAESHSAIHDAKWRYMVQPSDVGRSLVDIFDECESVAPPVVHPVVIEHPVRRTRSLYISRGFTVGFENLSHAQSASWLEQLLSFAEYAQPVHHQPWNDGEILIWDNRVLIHEVMQQSIDEVSVSYRIRISDGLPFYTVPVAPALGEIAWHASVMARAHAQPRQQIVRPLAAP
jgi:taurine dioxygenase